MTHRTDAYILVSPKKKAYFDRDNDTLKKTVIDLNNLKIEMFYVGDPFVKESYFLSWYSRALLIHKKDFTFLNLVIDDNYRFEKRKDFAHKPRKLKPKMLERILNS